MAELTDEQLERAVKIASATRTSKISWNASTGENGLELWRETMRTAAPFLQFPWDEPTIEEIGYAAEEFFGNKSCVDVQVARDVCIQFVRNRNAGLLPRAVDPRIDLIDRTLCAFMHSLNNTEERTKAAQAILAALDEVK